MTLSSGGPAAKLSLPRVVNEVMADVHWKSNMTLSVRNATPSFAGST